MNLSTRPLETYGPTRRHPTRPPGLLESLSSTHADLYRSDWRFLLPRLRYASLLYLGAPSAPVLDVLAGIAPHVTIATHDPDALNRLDAAVRGSNYSHVQLLLADPLRPLPLPSETFELIVARCAAASRLVRSSTCMVELDRLLDSRGCIYIETDRLVDALRIRAHGRRVRSHDFEAPRVLVPVHWRGVLRLVVPRGDADIARYCVEHVVAGSSLKGRILQRIAAAPVRLGLLPYFTPRRALLLRRPERGTDPGIVTDASTDRDTSTDRQRPLDTAPSNGAAAAGKAVTAGEAATVGKAAAAYAAAAAHAADRSALYARSSHDDNKVVLFVFGHASRPEIVVKIPRAPQYNHRLEHEHRCLALLRERGAVPVETHPEALFLDHHAGLAVHGQTVLHGAAFRNITTCRTDCPHAADAVEWITRLGETSAERAPAAADDLGDRLSSLLERFLQLYHVSDAEADFLDARIGALRGAAATVPRVFQHGDAGTANAVVDRRGRVGFFDWEDGDPGGLPLWDLFSFLLCFATWAGRVGGCSDDTLTYERSFIEPSALSRFQAEAVERYCDRVGVDRQLVEPLYFAHLIGRALRPGVARVGGSTDLPDFGALRLAIQNRNARGLTCMFR